MSETLTVPCSPHGCFSATDNQELPLVSSPSYSLYSIFYGDFKCILTCDPTGWIKVARAVGHATLFNTMQSVTVFPLIGSESLAGIPCVWVHSCKPTSHALTATLCVCVCVFYWDLLFCCSVFLSFIAFLQQKCKGIVSAFPLCFSCVFFSPPGATLLCFAWTDN